MRTPRRITLAFSLMLLGALVWAATAVEAPRKPLPPRGGPALAAAATWGYQLHNLEAARIPAGLDLLVADYSRDGSDSLAWTGEDVERLKRRPDGSRRIVLAALSVGRAEIHRFYWRRHWWLLPPEWLGEEEQPGAGRYPVRYWDPDWQGILLDPHPSLADRIAGLQLGWRRPYLDRVLEAGFDGVYLTGVEMYALWKGENGQAAREMANLVRGLSRYAKARMPGFLVVPQNGEGLLADTAYRASIDAIAKEDLLFTEADGSVRRRPEADVARSLARLEAFRSDGRPVFLVEYTDVAEQQAEARMLAAERGFVPLFAVHALDRSPALPLPELRSELPAGSENP